MLSLHPTILVPVNFSEASVYAAKYAYLIAHHIQAKIILFHAYYSPSLDLVDLVQGRGKKQLKKELSDSVQTSAVKQMNFFKQLMTMQVPQHIIEKVVIEEQIVRGIPEEEIVNFEKENEIDLVIMGSHGKSLQEEPIMGSITRKIIQRLITPILVIPVDYHFVGIENVKNIAYLTEFDEDDFESMKKLMLLTRNFDLTIHYIHFTKQMSSESVNKKINAFQEYFNNFYSNSKVICVKIEASEEFSELNNYVLEHEIKVLAITNRKTWVILRPFKKDFGNSLFYHTTVPLLFFQN